MEPIMSTKDLSLINFTQSSSSNEEELYSIPLDISDIINICREYSMLGYQMQSQVENIIEYGVEHSIKSGIVKKVALPHIKEFLKAITKVSYFGDAVSQADECIDLISRYEEKDIKSNSDFN